MLCLPGCPLSVLPARLLVSMQQQGRQLSCHCASKEVDAWVNTQKQCQWEGRVVSHLLPVLWASVPCPLHHREHSTGPLPRTASFLPCAHSSLQGDSKPDSPLLCPHPLHGTITQAWLAGFCLPEGLGVESWCSEPCSDPQLE